MHEHHIQLPLFGNNARRMATGFGWIGWKGNAIHPDMGNPSIIRRLKR